MNEELKGISAELYQAITAIVDERVEGIRVTHEDFTQLRGVVRELAQAQALTEQRLNELAQAQALTEQRLNELAQAQRELAEAQRDTQYELRNLAREVGSISGTIGFGLEDVAKVVIPGYLERHFNVRVEELERKFFTINGREVEINLYGEGKRNGKKIIILGEAKSRVHEREVRKFARQIFPLLPQLKEEALKVMFAFLIHPSADKLAEKEGIVLVASYQR